MGVTVYVKQGDGPLTNLHIAEASEVRYSKSNENNGKPDIVEILKNTEAETWEEYKVIAEFHARDIVGWCLDKEN